MVKILVGTPSYDDKVVVPYLRSMVAMVDECRKQGYQLVTSYSTGFTSRARNLHAALALADKSITHLLTIDADMGWPIGSITRLVEAKKQIVGATYPYRQLLSVPKFIGGVAAGSTAYEGFVKAKYIGCGFMLVERSVLETMAEKYPERKCVDEAYPDLKIYDLFPSGAFEGHTITDDMGFCRLAERIGYEIWADIAIPMTHCGQVNINLGPLADYVLEKKTEA